MTLPDANELCQRLAGLLRPTLPREVLLIGIHTGGVWVAERLHAALALSTPLGTMDVSFHRDDHHLAREALKPGGRASSLPASVTDARVVLVDDVLHTGRTVRAALNELFDYGRPARVDLAVLVDRGGRELPICATWAAETLTLPATQKLALHTVPEGLTFEILPREAKCR